MRSGITRYEAPCRRGTPCTTMRSVPAPWIRAPIATSSLARSTTSGSRAAFSITVSPSASAAAIIRFSVPVTVTRSVTIRVPRSRGALATMKPCSIAICAPSACRPLMCWSTGRAPIAQPPGSDTRACPCLATSGPSTSTDARIVLTSSYGASVEVSCAARSVMSVPSRSTVTPMPRSSRAIVPTSASGGTFDRCSGSSVSSAAAMIGSAAFLAPATAISPRSGTPPVIFSLSIGGSARGSLEAGSGKKKRGARSARARLIDRLRQAAGGLPAVRAEHRGRM